MPQLSVSVPKIDNRGIPAGNVASSSLPAGTPLSIKDLLNLGISWAAILSSLDPKAHTHIIS